LPEHFPTSRFSNDKKLHKNKALKISLTDPMTDTKTHRPDSQL